MKKNVVIPLYIIDLPEASNLKKVVESLDRLNEIKQRCQQQGPTQNQPQAQPKTNLKPKTKAQPKTNLKLKSKPKMTKMNPSEKSSKCQPKVTANRPNKLPIRRSRPRAAKQPITPAQIDQAPHCTSTKSKSSYFLKSTPSSTPTGLHDFDVHSLCQPQIGEVDVFDSDVEENLGQASDEESDHDDNEDSDFREWQSDGSEKLDSLSLDEDDDLQDENESLDNVDLENDTQLRMTIGHGSIHDDVGKNLLIVNKIARRGRPEKHKRRESRLPIPPKLSTIPLSGTKRKKPRQKTGNPVGRPRKIQRLGQASTSTVAASGVPTQSIQAL
ncbi:hypothetical protein Cgig2_004875 [Carnegiea gigantea]|uniref:Uncharacterized protein n=1 Tax=Carnegiea gigantea TaxID=171969 RepID=A0A9Q1Q8S7_9CARY|nr:hypothetical protein Cgig2_004875 [Carnegiea gigantea]